MTDSDVEQPKLRVVFYLTAGGREPVREWMQGLSRADRRIVGRDVKTAQYGWPLGMPMVRKIEPGLWEVRSRLSCGAGRITFTVRADTMVLLHAFLKKAQKTPAQDLAVARRRLSNLRRE